MLPLAPGEQPHKRVGTSQVEKSRTLRPTSAIHADRRSPVVHALPTIPRSTAPVLWLQGVARVADDGRHCHVVHHDRNKSRVPIGHELRTLGELTSKRLDVRGRSAICPRAAKHVRQRLRDPQGHIASTTRGT